MIEKTILAKFLTYAGALPFIGCLIVPFIQPDFTALNFNKIILTYSAVIVSFIAGIHWGIYMFKEAPINLFIHSNISTLFAWFAVLVNTPISFGIILICFFYLLFIDKQLYDAEILDQWYIRLRVNISLIVLTTLALYIIFDL